MPLKLAAPEKSRVLAGTVPLRNNLDTVQWTVSREIQQFTGNGAAVGSIRQAESKK